MIRTITIVVSFSLFFCADLFASLTNPTFDANTNGWVPQTCTVCTAPSLRWSNSDADSLASGSAVVNNTVSYGALGVGQCVAVAAGTKYTFGGRIFVPSGQYRTGQAYLGIIWHSNATCTGFINSTFSNLQYFGSTTPGAWVTDSVVGTAPANAVAAQAWLDTWINNGTGPNFEAHFDNLSFEAEHAPFITNFTPIGGFPGNLITINGTAFYGANPELRFNNTPAVFTVKSATRIEAVVPAGGRTGQISYSNAAGGMLSAQTFYYPPEVTSFYPPRGRTGASVGVVGKNFTNATNVRFGVEEAATFSVTSDTALNATVPTTATTAPIQVVNPSQIGGSTATPFIVIPPADFNSDGKDDVVLRNYTNGQNAVWLMNGTSVVSIAMLPALVNPDYRIEGTADFNADGHTDILLRNYSTGQNAVWLMNGTTLTGIFDLPPLANLDYHIEGTGDFNGDRKPDIILRNYVTGQNAVWLMNGINVQAVVDLPALPNTAYKFESAADFSGDGQLDIVLRNYTTGQDAFWLMNGVTLTGIVDLPTLSNTAYRFDGVGDFNADGKPDIVLRNYTTGQNAVWLLNGMAMGQIVDLPAVTNTAHEINGPR